MTTKFGCAFVRRMANVPPLLFIQSACSSASSSPRPFFRFLLFFLILLPPLSSAAGSTTAQCPDGHYLARFSSAFDGSDRFYRFSCAKFHGAWSATVLEEQCEVTDLTRAEAAGDVYMSCGSDQYTAGVRIVEGAHSNGQPIEWWQLLCCGSESVRVRTEDCVETKFINDFRRPSSFSSGAQIIRRWQAMSENGDHRWWLQICPVDVTLALKKHRTTPATAEVRARRQVPAEWRRGRFPTNSIHHYHRYTFGQQQYWQSAPILNKVNAFASGKQRQNGDGIGGGRGTNAQIATTAISTSTRETTTASSTTTTSAANVPLTATTTTIAEMIRTNEVPEKEEEEEGDIRREEVVDLPKLINNRSSPQQLELIAASSAVKQRRQQTRLHQFNERMRTRFGTVKVPAPSPPDKWRGANSISSSTTTTSTTPTTTSKVSRNEAETGVLDYYDMYDDNFDRAKHEGGGSLLTGLTDFVQSIQDGLTLAQAAFPAHKGKEFLKKGFHMRIAVPPPSTQQKKEAPEEFLFSRDEEAVEEENGNNGQQIGSFVQQEDDRKLGPNPRRPSPMETDRPTEAARRDPNTIESMLQMIGLCQGHATEL